MQRMLKEQGVLSLKEDGRDEREMVMGKAAPPLGGYPGGGVQRRRGGATASPPGAARVPLGVGRGAMEGSAARRPSEQRSPSPRTARR